MDAVIGWITDFALALPFLIFALAVVPTVALRFYGPRDAVPAAFQVGVLIVVFAVFGWAGTARLVRGPGGLAARAGVRRRGQGQRRRAGAHPVPGAAAEPVGADPGLVLAGGARVHHRRGGAVVPRHRNARADTPIFGRMIDRSLGYLQTDPAYVFFPGITIFALVFAFNLFGDALRDALDPRSSR